MIAGATNPQASDGDIRFLGVDMREGTGPGLLYDAENICFTDLLTQTRLGVFKPCWANLTNAGTANRIQPWSSSHGTATFKDPDSTAWLIIAAAGGVFRARAHNLPVSIPLPSGVEIHSAVTFTQAFDKLFMFRGRHLAPLVMADFDNGFIDLVQHWAAAETYSAGDEISYGPFIAVDSITRVNNTATVVTDDPHGYVTGADITIADADQAEYNGRHNIQVVDDTTFTFTVNGAPVTPATGTILCSNMSLYWSAQADALTPEAAESPDTDPTKWDRVYNILPNADSALYVNNRLLVPTAYEPGSADDYATFNALTARKKDYIVATDYLDYIHFDFSNEFRINQGSHDEIVDLLKFDDNTVLVFKGSSWGVLSNVAIDLTNLRFDLRSQSYGLSARGACTLAGSNVFFVSHRRGVVSVALSESGKLASVDLPLSAPIQPIINRINWTAAAAIRMESWDSRLYVAVPIDGASANNAILVHDFVAAKEGGPNAGWAPIATGSAIVPSEFAKIEVLGLERLLFLGSDGWVNIVEALDDGDQVADDSNTSGLAIEQITTRIVSREYLPATSGLARPVSASLVLQTLNPTYTATIQLAGVNRSATLCSSKTRSRTAYHIPFDAAAWDPTNTNDDHDTPGREDYSVVIPSGGLDLGAGIAFDRFQDTIHNFRVSGYQARQFRVAIENSTGRIKLNSISAAATAGRNRPGTLI